MNRQRKRNLYSVPARILTKLIIILLVIGIPGILFISTFNIKNLDVVGTKRYTSEQISNQIMKTKLDSNTLYLYLKYKYFSAFRMPFIEKLDVTMTDSHSITVYVYEKMVAGCVEFMGEYMYFDKDGIVVEASTKRLEDVPIIKGLDFSKIILSERIELKEQEPAVPKPEEELTESKNQKDQEAQKATEEQKAAEVQKKAEEKKEAEEKKKAEELKKREEGRTGELFNIIINLTQLIDKYELAVDTVTFNRNQEVIFDCGDITVLLGKKSAYDEALSELKNILTQAYGRKITIDMRNYVKGSENIVGKPKNTTK